MRIEDNIPLGSKFKAKCSDNVDRICLKYRKDTYPHWELIKILEEDGRNVEKESGSIDVKILSYELI